MLNLNSKFEKHEKFPRTESKIHGPGRGTVGAEERKIGTKVPIFRDEDPEFLERSD